MPAKPSLYKEFLVGLMVGGPFGPLVGWFIGTFAAFFAVAAMDTSNVRSMRSSTFIWRVNRNSFRVRYRSLS